MSRRTCDRCATPLLREVSCERGICSECHNRERFPQEWTEDDKRIARAAARPAQTLDEATRIRRILDALPKCVICGKGCVAPEVQKDADGKPAHLTRQRLGYNPYEAARCDLRVVGL